MTVFKAGKYARAELSEIGSTELSTTTATDTRSKDIRTRSRQDRNQGEHCHTAMEPQHKARISNDNNSDVNL